METKKCANCGKEAPFERKIVELPVRIGAHLVTQPSRQGEDVCGVCGTWTLEASEVEILELQAAAEVLVAHPLTGPMLKDLRHILGLKQTELGEKLGVAWETISRWEREERPMERWVALAVEALVRRELAGNVSAAA